MRRIDVLAICFGLFVAGGVCYGVFKAIGFDNLDAGIWSQTLFLVGLLGWVSTYLFRVGTRTMTFHKQREDYEEAILQRKLDNMTAEELAKLQAEIDAEEQSTSSKTN